LDPGGAVSNFFRSGLIGVAFPTEVNRPENRSARAQFPKRLTKD
jgi:hypothetical protein